ncbi:MAG: DUF2007 domain-containing protein [Verrucomicrobia bacterium]|jgi:hypothetical protein|nr:DUF2007 domain-containing protein [Verrucomicrobiota bacterium]
MTLVTVYRAFNPADAHLIRSRLDAAGFHAVVQHELAALTMEGYSQAAGGILVQVPDVEAESARTLIEATEDDPSEGPGDASPD